jgi:hypothetical protein
LVTIGCGGDDDDAAAGNQVVDSCTPNTKSTPDGTAMDPCPQTAPQCSGDLLDAVATCDATGHWTKDPANPANIMCACISKKTCGNGMLEAQLGEQCDGQMLNGATCTTLKPTSKGTLSCNAATCKYDTTLCQEMASTGGGGDGM